MAMLVIETERAWKALGRVTYGPTEAEKKSLMFRRSVYVAEDIEAGGLMTPQNLRIVRPGYGLHPRFYEQLLGKRVAKRVERGTAVTWDLLG
jgi:N-acetylneuraminate synthase